MPECRANIHSASPHHDSDDVPVGVITIIEPIPHIDKEDDLKAVYEHDANEIMTVIKGCLPQGTIDQLLIQLLEDRSSLLRTRAPQRRWTSEPAT